MPERTIHRGSLRTQIGLVLIAGATVALVYAYSEHSRRRLLDNHRHATMGITLILHAQADFYSANPRAFVEEWDGRVAGLRDHVLRGTYEPLKLLPEEIARADPQHANAEPFHGYWFVFLDDPTSEPDNTPVQNKARRAVCAYPAKYGKSGVTTFLYGRRGWLSTDTGGMPPQASPSDDEVKAKWSKFGG